MVGASRMGSVAGQGRATGTSMSHRGPGTSLGGPISVLHQQRKMSRIGEGESPVMMQTQGISYGLENVVYMI